MKKENSHLLEWVCLVTGGIMLVFSFATFNHGSLFLFLGAMPLLLGAIWLLPKGKGGVRKKLIPVTKRRVLLLKIFLIAVLVVSLGYTVLWNYFAYGRNPAKTGPATVIVLGCKIYEDQPSLMLRRRLERALVYLKENTEAVCVVSGGVGENETFSEAYVMSQFLVEQGISENRIFLEEKSTNTETNLEFSLNLVNEESLSKNLIICSDGFHQFRAYLYARRLGENPKAISAKTSFFVVPSYAVRELLGVLKMIVFG